MFVGQFATNKKRKPSACVWGEQNTPRPPKIAQPAEFRLKYVKKNHQKTTKIHLYMFIKMFVYMNSIFLFYFKVLHVCFFLLFCCLCYFSLCIIAAFQCIVCPDWNKGFFISTVRDF